MPVQVVSSGRPRPSGRCARTSAQVRPRGTRPSGLRRDRPVSPQYAEIVRSGEAATTHPIDRAVAAIAEEPLVAVDLALRAMAVTRGYRSDGETEYDLDVLGHAVCRASGLGAASQVGGFRMMLDEAVCHELACAALLRLLALDDEALAGPGMRGTVPLFDRVVGPRLYRGLDISTKSQTFEKVEALRSAMTRSEAALQAHIDSLGSLDALPSFRQELSRLFNDQVTQLAIRPFLPRDVTAQAIAEVFTSVQAVVDASDEELLEHADAAIAWCEGLHESVSELPTDYSRAMLGSLADKLLVLIRERVRDKGLADPAELSVRVREKRYPLSHVGRRVVLRLDVANTGAGQARDVAVSLDGHQHVQFQDEVRFLGQLPAGTRRLDFPGTVAASSADDAVLIRVTWRDPDGSDQEIEQIVDLLAWRRDVPWDDLAYQDPYPLEPVTRAGQFVGRERTLGELAKVVLASTPGNARVVGQRRVGKTSIVLALAKRLEELRPGSYAFVYAESGDFNANSAEATVERLGELLARKIIAADLRLGTLSVPSFRTGLSPLTELVEQAAMLAPDRRLIIALDEFDAMPQPDLYERGAVATALFQTLRSLGSKPNVGFIIVGGERMRFVIANHGLALNKFQLVPVDYFTEEHFEDYRALLTEPVAEWLEFDEPAIRLLHTETAGNPWITKLIAREIFARALANQDGDVRAEDVEAAVEGALPKLGASSFQHYWDDAIQGDVDEQTYVSVTRRKVLLALASCVRTGGLVTERAVCAASRRYGVDDAVAEDVLRGFRERGILVERGGGIDARVPLFLRWLEGEGVNEIVVTMGDDDALIRRQRAQEAARPKGEELAELVNRWRTYQGQLLAANDVRRWLNQFGEPSNQRLMLQLLQHLRYFNMADIAERLRELHGFVLRDLAGRGYRYTLSGRQRFRDDLVICGLEGGGSGAAHLVKPYRDENGIYAARAVDSGAVPAVLQATEGKVRAVLVLEDFMATGATAADRIRVLAKQWTANQPWPGDVDVYLLAIAGFDEAVELVRGTISEIGLPAHAHVAVALDDADRCFHDRSRVFPDADERERARALCVERGSVLDPKHPLGYRDTQAAVCFEMRCPNNSLPVLWKDGPAWHPLFPRMPRA